MIAEGVLVFFKQMQASEAGLRVSLIEVREGKPHRFLYFCPGDKLPRSPIAELQHEDSAVMIAIRDQRPIVNESNLAAEKIGRFRVTHPSRTKEDGSMVCYPILDRQSGEVVLTLCVCSTVSGFFKESKLAKLAWTLEKFGNRLILEYNLMRLKELVSKEDK